ncbi:MAG TPA: hypothetical protein VK787_00440 [Puia sp.]|jgi:hypothetical protein|nr:hypothetical protein [Puia sp.]
MLTTYFANHQHDHIKPFSIQHYKKRFPECEVVISEDCTPDVSEAIARCWKFENDGWVLIDNVIKKNSRSLLPKLFCVAIENEYQKEFMLFWFRGGGNKIEKNFKKIETYKNLFIGFVTERKIEAYESVIWDTKYPETEKYSFRAFIKTLDFINARSNS